jgi:hypothetical protein
MAHANRTPAAVGGPLLSVTESLTQNEKSKISELGMG